MRWYVPLFNGDVIHDDTISQFHFDAEHTLITNHTVLDVCFIANHNAGTNQALTSRLT